MGHEFLSRNGVREIEGIAVKPLDPVFPAVTCAAQATFRTGADIALHCMPGNGFFDRTLGKPLFWEQSSALVRGERIWEAFRKRGASTAMLFWQQSMGESADMIISPAPIHKHSGGMIQSCYSKPGDLYGKLCSGVGRPFDLKHYWGPLASVKSSDWIAEATAALLAMKDAPELCLTYLPGLDYDLQRFGPWHEKSRRSLDAVLKELKLAIGTARQHGYDVVVFGDYAIVPCGKGAFFPNRVLAEAGLMALRDVKGRLYPDFQQSAAFCIVDHEVAHVYTADERGKKKAELVFTDIEGVESFLDKDAQKKARLDCERSGDLVLVAKEGYWFAYPWWLESHRAPDYAAHVDIHNKPGYDPCELFFGWLPFITSMDTGRVRGSHGKTGKGRETVWGSTCDMGGEIRSLKDLALRTKEMLGR